MKTITVRTLSGAVYVAIVVLTIYSGRLLGNQTLGCWIFGLFLFAVTMVGTHEVVKNLRIKGSPVNAPVAYLLSATVYGLVFANIIDSLFLLILPFFALFISLICMLFVRDSDPIASFCHALLPALWVAVPLTLMAVTTDDYIWGDNYTMLIFILIWVNDSFAYLTGRLLGRHKMSERHSPNKTWEGTIGGVLFCMAAAIVVGPLLLNEARWIECAVLGLVCGVVGTLGDLVESMFKRSCGVKDSGNIMPGHGGVLDRFDSILMVTPFAYALLVFLF